MKKNTYLIITAAAVFISACFLSYNILIWAGVFLAAGVTSYLKYEKIY